MPRLAHRDRDRQRLHLRIGGLDDGEIGHAERDFFGDRGLGQPAMPLRGRGRGPHRLGRQHLAAMRRRRAEHFDIAALDAQSLQQGMHRELRMIRGRRHGEFALRVPDAADLLPRFVVEIGIESRQHHRALRQRAHGVQEFRRGRHRSGRAGGNHRTVVMRGEAFGLCLDQKIAPRRRLDFLDGLKIGRPGLPRDLQKGRANTASIGRVDPAPVRRACPSRRRGSPCRRSGAPDRRPAPASMRGRRPQAAPIPDPSPTPRPVLPA